MNSFFLGTPSNKIITRRSHTPAVEYCRVTFAIGDNAVRLACGELQQEVAKGGYCAEPILSCKPGYVHVGWDRDFIDVQDDMQVNALYETDPVVHYTFSVEEHGIRIGGGQLEQDVYRSAPPELPEISVEGGWRFRRYDYAYGTDRISANAVYDRLKERYDVSLCAEAARPDEVSGEVFGNVFGGGQYLSGSVIEISAIPTSDYYFIGWSDLNLLSVRQISVDDDVSLSALFDHRKYMITEDMTEEEKRFIAGVIAMNTKGNDLCSQIID